MDASSIEDRVRLRSEAEAPWRGLRLAFFGGSVLSAGIGLLVSIPQLIGALNGAPGALALNDVAVNLGVDGGAVALFAWLFSQDWKARDRQMARLGREEGLSLCFVQLANGKKLQLGALRGSARVVVCAGTPSQVKDALDAAEEYKVELSRRGVLVVPLPIYEETEDGAQGVLAPPTKEDLRWRATPIQLEAWKAWFSQQLALTSKAKSDRGLYVSLRKDGRVRGSGMGRPPWAQLAVQLPPEEGAWAGMLDGMDGKV